MNALADCIELIYSKLGFFKGVMLTMIIAITIFIIDFVYTITYISAFVDFFFSIF